MATPDLAALQAQVEKLKRDYTDLTKKPASLFDVSNPIKAAAAVKSLTDQIELAKEKASRLEEGFGGIYETVVAIVGELKKNNTQADLATKAFGKIQSITQKLKYDQQGISELSLKELKNNKKKLESLQSEVISQAKSISDKYKKTKFEDESLLLNKKGEELNKSQLKVRATSLGLTVQQLKEEASILEGYKEGFTIFTDMNKELTERLNLEKKVQSDLGITGGLLKGISKIPILGDMFDASDAVEEMETHLRGGGTATQALSIGLKNVKGQIIDGLLNPANLIVGVFTLMVETLKGTDSAIGDLAKGFDMSYNSAANLRMELTDIANFSMDVAVTTKGLQESMMAIGQTLGVNAQLNKEDLVTFTKLREQAGYTNDELVGIQKLTLAQGGSLEDNAKSFLGTVEVMNAQNKLSINAKQLLKEVANVSDSIKLSVGGTTEKLAEAAFKAKQFGINLQQADGIASSLLNFESSIADELSAELITGKDLNLEKARLLAINGDIAGASAEILKQIKGSAEFTKMNRIQQEALAKAVGMSRDDLAKSLVDREASAKLGAKEGQSAQDRYNELVKSYGVEKASAMLGDEALARQFQQQSVQERFAQSIEKLKELFVSLVEPLMPVFDVFADIMGVVGPIVGVVGTLLKYTIQWGKYLLIPLGIMKGFQLVMTGIAATQAFINGLTVKDNASKATGNVLLGIGNFLTAGIFSTKTKQSALDTISLMKMEGLVGLEGARVALQNESLGVQVRVYAMQLREKAMLIAGNVLRFIRNTLGLTEIGIQNVSNKIAGKGLMVRVGEMIASMFKAGAEAPPPSNLILPFVFGAIAGGIGGALIAKYAMKDGVIDPRKGPIMSGGFGSVQLDPKDKAMYGADGTIKVGTNLGGGKGNSQQSAYMDPALLNEMRAMRQEQAQRRNNYVMVENSVNGTRFGTALHMNTYKIQ